MGKKLRLGLQRSELMPRIGSFLLIGGLFLGTYLPVNAKETNQRQAAADDEDCIILYGIEEGGQYTVQEGDCLWKIAERYCGDGRAYLQIAENNGIKNPDIILKGQELSLNDVSGTASVRIPKQKESQGGIEYKGIYQFDMPVGWTVRTTEVDSKLSFIAPQGEERGIFWNVSGNRFGEKPFSEDWDGFCADIAKRGEEIMGLEADAISFERYRTQDGDEIYLYSFETSTEEETSEPWRVAAGCYFGSELQAEFIGISPAEEDGQDRSIADWVLYMAASFQEYAKDGEGEGFDQYGGNDGYLASEYWDYEGLHNTFAIAYRAINGEKWRSPEEEESMLHIADGQDEMIEWHNPVVELGIKYYLDKGYDDDVSLSELEDITFIGATSWPTGDIFQVNDVKMSCSFDEIWEDFVGEMPLEQMRTEFGETAVEDMKYFVNLEQAAFYSMPHADVLDYGIVFAEDLEVPTDEMSGRLQSFTVDGREYVK